MFNIHNIVTSVSSILMFIGAIDIFRGGHGYIAAVGCILWTILIIVSRLRK